MEKNLLKRLPLVPLRDVVVFPHITLPLYVGRQKSLLAIEESQKYAGEILLVAQKNAQSGDPKSTELHSVATRATIKQFSKLSDGNVKILIEGKERVQIKSFSSDSPFFEAIYEPLGLLRRAVEEDRKWMVTLIKHT